MNVVKVPAGIGDVSWMYSKLKFAPKMHWLVADGWPYRTKQFLELLPEVETANYGNFQYTDIICAEEAIGVHGKDWKHISQYEEMFLESNSHLEAGKPLADWLPDLPVDYHYEINTNDRDADRAVSLLTGISKPIFGVSAASYRGSEAWKTWGYTEWSKFLSQLKAETGASVLLLGGFWDDLTHALASDGYPDLVGKTSIGSAVEILRRLDGYIGFSSGLGILGTVLSKRVFMLWPDHQEKLSTSWAPPHMLESKEYVATLWRDPDVVWPKFKDWLYA